MAEAVGLVLGVAGLAGLFSTCLECLDYIHLGSAYARDFEIIQTKYETQKVRFMIWGQVVGLVNNQSYDERLDLPTIRPTVERVLNCIKNLFTDANQLTRNYGLKPGIGHNGQGGEIVVFKETYRRFRQRLTKTQRDATIATKSKWAISDNRNFENLVRDLKDFVDALEDITRSLQLLQRQRDTSEEEIESVSDSRSLELLLEATSGIDDQVSEITSLRMLSLGSHTRSLVPGSSARGAASSRESWHTAETKASNLDETVTGDLAQLSLSGASDSQNRRIVRDAAKLSAAGNHKRSIGIGSQPFAESHNGLSIRATKQKDISHCRDVVQRSQHTTNPETKRMVLIFENILNTATTPFVSLAPIEDNLCDLLGSIEGPQSSPYEGGVFFIRMAIPEDFPFSPPTCRFLTRIYHPNIDATGKICLDILQAENWRFELMYLETILISICSLLDEPNMTDRLVPEIAQCYLQNVREYEAIARRYTKQYASGICPPLSQEGPVVSGGSWKYTFLNERLVGLQKRTSIIIGALQGIDSRSMNSGAASRHLLRLTPSETATSSLYAQRGSFLDAFIELNCSVDDHERHSFPVKDCCLYRKQRCFRGSRTFLRFVLRPPAGCRSQSFMGPTVSPCIYRGG